MTELTLRGRADSSTQSFTPATTSTRSTLGPAIVPDRDRDEYPRAAEHAVAIDRAWDERRLERVGQPPPPLPEVRM